MKNKFILLIIFILASYKIQAQAPLINYTFWDTVRYQDVNFSAPETFFSDINAHLEIAGYFKNISGGRTGFIYDYKKKVFVTYQHPGYVNTEITGINDAGKILGRAYDNSTTAITIKGEFSLGAIQNIQTIDWYAPGAQSQLPKKVNNNDFCVGAVQAGTTRWLHLQELSPPFNNQSTQRVEIGATQYNTYGNGMNDNGLYTGYYLNGSEYIPLIWDDPNTQFYYNIPHKNTSVALKRTFITDINNDGYFTVDYRDSSNIMQGTIGLANLANLNNVTYETYNNSIFGDSKSPFGSGFEGINNYGDIVGYYKIGANEPVGFIALTDVNTPEIPGVFDDTVNQFNLMVNSLDYFYYDSLSGPLAYDYTTTDPWTLQNENILDKVSFINPKINENRFINNQIYPSWYAYVYTQGEDKCYVPFGNSKKIKLSEIIKWIQVYDTLFKGSCSGISLFWLQHLKDPLVLTSRYNGIQSASNIENYFVGSPTLPSHFTKEAMNSLQLFQNRPSLKIYANSKNAHTSTSNSLKKAFLSISKSLYELDSVRILGMRYDAYKAYHHTVPIKATREFKLNGKDSIFIMNPNFNNQWTVVVNDPTIPQSNFPCREYYKDQNNVVQSLIVPFIDADFQLHEAEISNTTDLVFKTVNNEVIIGTKALCDFKIENETNPSQYFERINNVETNLYPSIIPQFQFNDDTLVDGLSFPSSTNFKSYLKGGCDSSVFFSLSYGEGAKIFSRNKALPNETDIVLHSDNLLKIENPDAVDKFPKFNLIYGSGNTEALVSIDSFKISQNDTVRFEVLDQFNYLLTNGFNQNNIYNLYVRFLGTNEFFEWKTASININPNTNHIIQLRPTLTGNEVIILIDSLQNGTIDDSTKIVNTSLTIKENEKNIYDLSINPNPGNDNINISSKNLLTGNYNLEIYNNIGQLVLNEKVEIINNNFNKKISTSNFKNGVYILRLSSKEKNIEIKEKILIQH